MNFLLFRKLQLVCILSDRIEHSKRPKKLFFQFPIVFDFDIFAV